MAWKYDERQRETHEDERGTLILWSPAPGIFASESRGHLSLDHARAYVSYGNRVLMEGLPAIGLHDWMELESYDTAGRREVTTWALDCVRRFESIDVALESQIVKMGVALANVALFGRITVHTDIDVFRRAYANALDRRSGGAGLH
jgi:hypothetical protein